MNGNAAEVARGDATKPVDAQASRSNGLSPNLVQEGGPRMEGDHGQDSGGSAPPPPPPVDNASSPSQLHLADSDLVGGGTDSWSDISDDDADDDGPGALHTGGYALLTNPHTEEDDGDNSPDILREVGDRSGPAPSDGEYGHPTQPSGVQFVAAEMARSMFPAPARPPPVAAAVVEADDIELTDDKADEIRSLMSSFSLPLPPGGLPLWVDAIGSGSGDTGSDPQPVAHRAAAPLAHASASPPAAGRVGGVGTGGASATTVVQGRATDERATRAKLIPFPERD
jgi:hypothetical protein